jgi:hypothetical protein
MLTRAARLWMPRVGSGAFVAAMLDKEWSVERPAVGAATATHVAFMSHGLFWCRSGSLEFLGFLLQAL